MIKIVVKHGNIIDEKTEAIVNPSNSYGIMGGGVAKAIKDAGGAIIEAEAVRKAPINVGKAVITQGGMLFAKHIIHAPTMEMPAGTTSEEKIRKAVAASLLVADENRLLRISMPGMGTGVGGFEPIDAARIIVEEIKRFRPKFLKELTLIDVSEIMANAFKEALKDAK